MGRKSILYISPRIFKTGLKLLHGKKFDQRYEYIASQIGEDKSVQEVACGPAVLAEYLHPTNTYRGFDTNTRFIRYAQKKGIHAEVADATDSESYSEADVGVLCDSFHHLGPQNETQVLTDLLNSSKEKIIICDPYNDNYMKMLPDWLPGKNYLLKKYFNYIEKDGMNQVRLENTRSRKKLMEEMLNGFGVIPESAQREIKEIGEDLIVTYTL